jgi:hypothetical protein
MKTFSRRKLFQGWTSFASVSEGGLGGARPFHDLEGWATWGLPVLLLSGLAVRLATAELGDA